MVNPLWSLALITNMMLFLYEKKSGNAFAFKRTFCIFANKTIGILEKMLNIPFPAGNPVL